MEVEQGEEEEEEAMQDEEEEQDEESDDVSRVSLMVFFDYLKLTMARLRILKLSWKGPLIRLTYGTSFVILEVITNADISFPRPGRPGVRTTSATAVPSAPKGLFFLSISLPTLKFPVLQSLRRHSRRNTTQLRAAA